MAKVKSIYIDINAKPNHDFDIKIFKIKEGQKSVIYKGKRYKLVNNPYQGLNSTCFILERGKDKLFLKLTDRFEHICVGLKGFSKILDYGNASLDGELRYYYLYEYIEGITIHKAIKNGIILKTKYFHDLLEIVKGVNRAGFLFFDFNLENFMIDKSGSLVCVDHGSYISLEHAINLSGIVALNCACCDLKISNTIEKLENNKYLIETDILFKCLALDHAKFDSKELNEDINKARSNNALDFNKEIFTANETVQFALSAIKD